jgi:hypothetical protein
MVGGDAQERGRPAGAARERIASRSCWRPLAAFVRRHQLEVGIEGEKERGPIAVRIGEGEIAAHGADVPHPGVGHVSRDR